MIPRIPISMVDPQATLSNPQRTLTGPIQTGTIVPDTEYGVYANWIYVGTTGTLTYIKWDGSTQLLNGIASGVWHPIHSIMVATAGTTATGLVWGN